jgi:hypothetical protein
MAITQSLIYILANTDDYSQLSSVLLTFTPGSANGTEVCSPITVVPDDLVECEESFTVALTLVTSGASISLGNRIGTVTLLDSDGTCSLIQGFWLNHSGELDLWRGSRIFRARGS